MCMEFTLMSDRRLCDREGGADGRGQDEVGDDDVSHGKRMRNGDGMAADGRDDVDDESLCV